jgi:hypothetical protein
METTQKYRVSKQNLVDFSKSLLPNFQLSEHTDYLYSLVTLYLNNDPDFEKYSLKRDTKSYPFSLKKGLFLISAPGAGKSFLFEDLLPMFAKYFPAQKYRPISVYKLQDLYQKHGAFAIDEFNNSVYSSTAEKNEYNLYIDDIGRELRSIKFFGNEMFFMDMFIDARIRLSKRGFKTHGSSNLNMRDLKTYYSDATFSRMFALFNFIVIDNKIDYRIEL